MTPSPDAPATRWYRPGVADLVFLLIALAAFRGARHTLLDDPGLGWHLRNIDAILANEAFLTEDPFTDPRGGEPREWLTNQWLGELPYWVGWRWAGLEGVAAVNALVIGLMARVLCTLLLREGMPWPVAVLWTALAAMGTSCSWNARPNTFTLLFVLLTSYACERFHAGAISRRATWWLVPLFAVWANTHGGFVAGLIIVAATLGIAVAIAVGAPGGEGRREARRKALHLVLLAAGCFAATLLNPYGADLYRWVFALLGDRYFMELHQEWRSPDFHGAGAMRFELMMLLFPLVLALTSRRPNLVAIVLCVLFLHFALSGFRYVALWVVVAAPVLARASMGISYLHELGARLRLPTAPGSLFAPWSGPVPWRASVGVVLLLLGGAKAAEGAFARHKQEIIATRAVDELIVQAREWEQQSGRRPVIFHSYDWGGYLTWHGWPGLLNWVDDRNEVQGRERVEEYMELARGVPGWERKLTAVDLVCVEARSGLAEKLTRAPGWRETYRDAHAVLFVRHSPPGPGEGLAAGPP